MALKFKDKSSQDLADMYAEDKGLHTNKEFWRAYIEKAPGCAGKILGTYFLNKEIDIDPDPSTEPKKLSILLSSNSLVDLGAIIPKVQAAFTDISWDSPNSLEPHLYSIEQKESGRVTAHCLCSETIHAGSSLATRLSDWFETNTQG